MRATSRTSRPRIGRTITASAVAVSLSISVNGGPDKTYEINPARTYQVPTELLDSTDVQFATLMAYALAGHRHGGTRLPDNELAQLVSASAATVARARAVLARRGHITERRDGRQTVRQVVHPRSFVALHWYPVQRCTVAQPPGRWRIFELRLYAVIQHTRAEPGKGAGCALTRAELAARLHARPDRVGKAIAWLRDEGLLTVIHEPGRPWVLVPRFAHAVTRAIAPEAVYALAQKRREARAPRRPSEVAPAPLSTAPRPRRRTPLPYAGLPPLSFADQQQGSGRSFPQVAPRTAGTALNEGGFNEAGAPWDVPGATWRPPRPPDWRDIASAAERGAAARPPGLRWQDYRTQPAAVGVSA